MAMFTDLINSQYRAEYIIEVVRQEVTRNRSLVRRTLRGRKLSGSGHFTFSGQPWSVSGGGSESGTYLYDYSEYEIKVIYQDEVWIDHLADGTRSVTFSASVSMAGPLGGTGTPSGTVTLPTIPRATQPEVEGPVNAGDTLRIDTPRASSSFRHMLYYSFEGATGLVGEDVGTSVTWTVPIGLLNRIPSATSGKGTITCKTYNGDTLIGTKTVSFTVRAASNVVPTIGSLTVAEAVPEVASAVGAYVQGQSRLSYSIGGAAGVYGSTITAYKLAVAGQTVDGQNGTTGALAASGTMNAVATVTDSRGRTATRSVSITVLPWAVPQITLLRVQRCLANGTLDDNGTYFKFTVAASVSSLLVGGAQKNVLRFRARTKQKGATVWGSTALTTHAGITLSATFVVGTYSEQLAWDARFEVSDAFTTSAAQALVSVGAVALDIGPGGIGVGKRWERGALDVAGDIYLTGRIIGPHQAFGEAAGRVDITPTAADTPTGLTIVFPVGRFTQAPRIQVTPVTTVPGTVVKGVSSAGTTPSGTTIYLTRSNTSTTAVDWEAKQMTPTSAEG